MKAEELLKNFHLALQARPEIEDRYLLQPYGHTALVIIPPVEKPSSFLLDCIVLPGEKIVFGKELLKGPILVIWPADEWIRKTFKIKEKAFLASDLENAVNYVVEIVENVKKWVKKG